MIAVDPDTALANLRNALARMRAAEGHQPNSHEAFQHAAAAAEVADAAEALDEWLSKGSYLPAAWAGAR